MTDGWGDCCALLRVREKLLAVWMLSGRQQRQQQPGGGRGVGAGEVVWGGGGGGLRVGRGGRRWNHHCPLPQL